MRLSSFRCLAAAAALQVLAGPVTLQVGSAVEAFLEPGEIRTFRVIPSEGGVTWNLSGPGRMAWDPAWSGEVMYRAPRSVPERGERVLLTAVSDRDQEVRAVFRLELGAQAAPPPPARVDLRALLPRTGGDRRQGNCSDCYAWAATAALEVELAARYGIRDRLSIQFFHAIYTPKVPGDTPDPCCPNAFSSVLEHYRRHGLMVPWSNPGAAFQDRFGRCGEPREARPAVGRFPHYRVRTLESTQIETRLWSREECIAEIQSVLARRKAIIFHRKGHFMNIVGYDAADADPARHAWLVLDSAGAPERAPDGVFSLPMRSLDYHALRGPMEPELEFDYVEEFLLEAQPPGIARVHVEASGTELALGDPLELAASVEAQPPVSYQWLKDGAPLEGCTGSVLSLAAVTRGDAGAYQVRVADAAGSSATSDRVPVGVAEEGRPGIRIQPCQATLGEDGEIRFHAAVSALADGRVAWSLTGPGTLEEIREGSVRFTASGGAGPRTLEARAVADPGIRCQVPIQVKGSDLNGDGQTDILDLALLAQAYRSLRGDPRYLEAADLNGDGAVDEADALAFLKRWDALP